MTFTAATIIAAIGTTLTVRGKNLISETDSATNQISTDLSNRKFRDWRGERPFELAHLAWSDVPHGQFWTNS